MKKKITLLLGVALILGVSFSVNGQIDNTIMGEGAGANNTGSYNSGYGKYALMNNSNHSNCAFGILALKNNAGGFNVAFGNEALTTNTTGTLNCAIGTRAMLRNDTGSNNIAIGHRTLEANITGNYNTSIGYASLLQSAGNGNIALGYFTPRNLKSGDDNTFIGTQTGINLVTGSYNVFLGKIAVESDPSTNILSGNDATGTVVLADGRGNQRMFISKYGNVGIGLGNNVIPNNKLDISGGVVIGRNYVSKSMPAPTLGVLAPSNGMLVEGKVGIGNTNPNSKLEITDGTLGNSGLRFTNLTSDFIPTTVAADGKCLTVNANGDVVLQKLPNSETTNQLNSENNTITSTVNSIEATASIVNSISNSVTATNQLVTTVNGVSSAPIDLPVFAELDGSTTNELQTITQVGNVITLSNGGGSVVIPSSSDNQSLSLVGNNLTISNGNTIVLPSTNVVAGTNVSVTGNGSVASPFQISSLDKSIYADNGSINTATTINGNRVVDLNNSNIWFNSINSESNGKIYIGGTATYPYATGNYRLYVEGGILTEKVKVALRNSANWADYVFAPEYKLMPLHEVEQYVSINKHLPGVDSAKDLAEKGIDVVEMQSKQMEKIEELTLYIIEQDKKIESQNKAIEQNTKDIEELKAQLQALIQKK
jgi:hypothetical protein